MVNTAFQLCLADGVEVICLHHPRKATQTDARRILSIDDVYGSTWLTSGHGSVLCLQQGRDPDTVTLTQLKTVNTELPPTDLLLDGAAGTLTPTDVVDTGARLRAALAAAPDGLTVKAAARMMFGTDDSASIERARRALDKLVKDDLATGPEHSPPGLPKIYRAGP
jgi:replicative DNA helicase